MITTKPYSGKPCKWGHSAPRYVIGGRCIECARRAQLTPEARLYKRAYSKRPETRAADAARYCGERKARQLARQRSPEWLATLRMRNATREGKAHAAELRLRIIDVPLPPLDGKCGCCGSDVGWRRLRCDHDHETHKFRAWVCNGCNTGTGLIDNPNLLRRRAALLERAA